jgi:hypothetical protein
MAGLESRRVDSQNMLNKIHERRSAKPGTFIPQKH